MDVSCGAPGMPLARDFRGGQDRALAPWDGVFFELARARDFAQSEGAVGNSDPPGSRDAFHPDYGKNSAVTPAPREVDPGTGTRTCRRRGRGQ
jgi:hypothetical protein